MIIDGRSITKEILQKVHEDIASIGHEVLVRAIVLQPSAATESYLSIKERRARDAGMFLDIVRMENDATTEDLLEKIALPGADAVIVQLPLPDSIDSDRVLNAIPLALDADALSTVAHTEFTKDRGALLPPVVDAMREILERAEVNANGMRAVVVGQGWLVGEPAAAWLAASGATVEVVTKESGDLSLLKEADIVVLGAGSPGLVTPAHLKRGVVLIDAGTSESGGAIVGDADPACATVASVFTPVPGGVGPIAVACLFRNVGNLALRAAGKAL